MKKDGTQKIKLKKLTIARINTDTMRKIEGGSSGTTLPTNIVNLDEDELWNICVLDIK